MRILTLVAGENSIPEVRRLTAEIRAFNTEIDFRLRFLHIEIDELFVLPAGAPPGPPLEPRVEIAGDPLEAAARLALLFEKERPDLVAIVGRGPLLEPGTAAARACGVRVGFFGAERGAGGLDLGRDAHGALERLTGVAREIR